MSEFDGHAEDVWDQVESVFGDQAVWKSQGYPDLDVIVVADADYRQILSRGGERIVSISYQLLDMDRAPLPGDLVTVRSGRCAGEYEYIGIIEDDGYTVTTECRKIG